jgi:hypothetical protein
VDALADSSALVRRRALQHLRRVRAVEATPYIIPFLNGRDEPSRQAAAAALASFGPAAAGYSNAVRRIANGGGPAVSAAALRVLGAMGALDKQDGPRLIQILRTRFNERPVLVRRDGPVIQEDWSQLQAVSAYVNALRALGSLGPAWARYAGEVDGFLHKLENDGEFQISLRGPTTELVPAALYALARLAPRRTATLRAIMRNDHGCAANAAAVSDAGLPNAVIGTEILLPLVSDSAVARRCLVAFIKEWPAVVAQYRRQLVMPSKTYTDSVFIAWSLRRVHPDYVVRRMIGREPMLDGDGRVVGTQWQRVAQLDALFRDTALARQAEAGLAGLLTERDNTLRGGAALSLSSIGRLPAWALDTLLAGVDTTTDGRAVPDDLFLLLLQQRHFTTFTAKAAENAISYDLTPFRDSLSAPGLFLAAMGEQPLSRVVTLLELGNRKFVASQPNRYPFGRDRARSMWLPMQPERLLVDSTHAASLRLLAYLVAPRDMLPWVRWVGRWRLPERAELEKLEGSAVLPVLLRGWDASRGAPGVRVETGAIMVQLVRYARWRPEDVRLLRETERRLRSAELLNEADVVAAQARALTTPDRQRFVRIGVALAALHACFWILLILVYPRSALVQSWFFWSPLIRKVAGFGYVNLLLVWNPFLRRRLFEPFRGTLASGAAADEVNLSAYKEGVEVRASPGGERIPIETALPAIRGQVVLEGPSGLGKTMYLRRLVLRADRPTVYLPAHRCGEGVIRAVQAILPGMVSDEAYLLRLLHAGALDICIDGMNEVSADVRVRIRQFMESSPRANVLAATQPLDWGGDRPTAKFLEILPLGRSQVASFLRASVQQMAATPGQAEVHVRACEQYLDEVFDSGVGDEIRDTMLAVLSNPLDLTVVASLLVAGEKPNLFDLRRQQYERMDADYGRIHQGSHFPLRMVAKAAYAMRLEDNPVLPWTEFPEAVALMAEHRFVVRKELPLVGPAPEPRFQFRHEKIADYFIASGFEGVDDPRLRAHVSDPRFRGVYLTLALTLPLDEAEALERLIVVRAAEEREHSLSDPYVRMVELRRRLAAAVFVALPSITEVPVQQEVPG